MRRVARPRRPSPSRQWRRGRHPPVLEEESRVSQIELQLLRQRRETRVEGLELGRESAAMAAISRAVGASGARRRMRFPSGVRLSSRRRASPSAGRLAIMCRRRSRITIVETAAGVVWPRIASSPTDKGCRAAASCCRMKSCAFVSPVPRSMARAERAQFAHERADRLQDGMARVGAGSGWGHRSPVASILHQCCAIGQRPLNASPAAAPPARASAARPPASPRSAPSAAARPGSARRR